ncbi:inorganic polyphosphate/ATP-NAD kinase [Mesorhizobium loti]|nr:inorganic polyphosphate/ATP-NAD kinase [Mesorhizobium loti]
MKRDLPVGTMLSRRGFAPWRNGSLCRPARTMLPRRWRAARPAAIGRDRGAMSTAANSIAFVSSDTADAKAALESLSARYGQCSIADAAVVVALGGDGFLLQTLRDTMGTGKKVYGMNRGTIGFLMNEYRSGGLTERIAAAVAETIRPLEMLAVTSEGETLSALAINEVALWRQSYQTAKIRISVDDQIRLEELSCDGVMIATPAGSTAYNLSAHGPILPLDAPLLALTPVSPFRPRRWRGALLSNKATVRFDILEPEKRPVNAAADHTEVKAVTSVTVRESPSATATLLFDPNHSWNERILAEQFRY